MLICCVYGDSISGGDNVSICCVDGDSNSGGDVVCLYAVYMVTALVGVTCVDMLCIW